MLARKNISLVQFTPDGSLNAYMKQVYAIPVLTLEEEQELTQRFWKHMDFSAAQKLVLAHLRLVVKIARNFQSYELPIQDIISEGNIGLMKAVQKFSPDAGCRLATYASWWIRAAIQEYILNSWSMVKMSTNVMKQKLFCKLRKTKEQISSLDDDTTLSHLKTISLDNMCNEHSTFADTITSDEVSHAEAFIESYDDQGKRSVLQKGMAKLNEREKAILNRRHLKEIPDKLGDIAKEYGISSERVRQIEGRIMEKLKAFALQSGYT